MSGGTTPLPADGNGLLRGSRTRSYGSLFRAQLSPIGQRRIEHQLQPGETLPGLALKYGVTIEQIKRANRLYTNDSIFLKRSLSIPVLSDAGEDDDDDIADCAPNAQNVSEKMVDAGGLRSDLTPVDFLKRLDELIQQSKQAAVRGCEDAERRVAALEAACSNGMSERRRFTRSQSSTTCMPDVAYRAPPLTVTKLALRLRDREDEIFEL